MSGGVWGAFIRLLGGDKPKKPENNPTSGTGKRHQSTHGSTLDDTTDFEHAGREVMHELVLNRVNLRHTDLVNECITPIWRNPVTGAVLYIGNHIAASDANFLMSRKISCIVNCTRPGLHGKGELPNYHEGTPNFTYYNFPVARWRPIVNNPRNNFPTVLDFFIDMFQFAENSMNAGHSVLIHCLAGAHRAGTSGVAAVMYFAGVSRDEALSTVQALRPIVDPIGSLFECLTLLDACLNLQRNELELLDPNGVVSKTDLATTDIGSPHEDGEMSVVKAFQHDDGKSTSLISSASNEVICSGRSKSKKWMVSRKVAPFDGDVNDQPPLWQHQQQQQQMKIFEVNYDAPDSPGGGALDTMINSKLHSKSKTSHSNGGGVLSEHVPL